MIIKNDDYLKKILMLSLIELKTINIQLLTTFKEKFIKIFRHS